jgi:hypothetical protein
MIAPAARGCAEGDALALVLAGSDRHKRRDLRHIWHVAGDEYDRAVFERGFRLGRRRGAEVDPGHRDVATSRPGVILQRVGIHVRRETDLHIVGMRPDDCDLRDVAAERQQPLLVLEQRHRCGGEPLRELDALACDGANLGRVLRDVRVFEQTQRKLVAQHAAHGPVQKRLGHLAVAHGLSQQLPVAVDRRQLDVHACREGEQPRLLGSCCDLLAVVQEGDGDVVGHDGAREAHAVAQHVRQNRARRGDRHAVELRIAGHHRREPGEPECGLEGTGVDVVELTRSDGGRRHVLAAFGHRVADEVLRGRQHARG